MNLRQASRFWLAGSMLAAGMTYLNNHEAEKSHERLMDTDCEATAVAGPIGSMAVYGFGHETNTVPEDNSNIVDFVDEHEGMSTLDMANAYIGKAALGEKQVSVIKVQKEALEDKFDELNTPDDLIFKNTVSLIELQTLFDALKDYPPSLLKALDIDTVKIVSNKDFAGSYITQKNEVDVNIDALIPQNEDPINSQKVLAHEILGHAIHDAYCQGHTYNDKAISSLNNGFQYIGALNKNADGQQIQQHEALVSDALVDYGPNRIFVTRYGATNVMEDVATIVEFTLHERGLIQPGDADYGSPLQKKQNVIVGRMEKLFPGFNAIAKNQTKILRRLPRNEIYSSADRMIDVPPSMIPKKAKDLTFDQTDTNAKDLLSQPQINVLNGIFYDPKNKNIVFYPAVSLDSRGDIVQLIYKADEDTTENFISIYELDDSASLKVSPLSISYFGGDLQSGDIVIMSAEEFKKTTKISPVTSSSLDDFFATPRQAVSTAP